MAGQSTRLCKVVMLRLLKHVDIISLCLLLVGCTRETSKAYLLCTLRYSPYRWAQLPYKGSSYMQSHYFGYYPKVMTRVVTQVESFPSDSAPPQRSGTTLVSPLTLHVMLISFYPQSTSTRFGWGHLPRGRCSIWFQSGFMDVSVWWTSAIMIPLEGESEWKYMFDMYICVFRFHRVRTSRGFIIDDDDYDDDDSE